MNSGFQTQCGNHCTGHNDLFNYRPQQYLRKGNVFTSVCQEFCPGEGGGVVCLGRHPLGRHHLPGQPLLGRHPLRHPRQTPPCADNPWTEPPPLVRHPPGQYTPRAETLIGQTPPTLGRHPPPWAYNPHPGQTPPWADTPLADTSPPPPRRPLQQMAVRILLECILVFIEFRDQV